MQRALLAACLFASCVPIRHVDRGQGLVVEDGRCADLLYRDHVVCSDDTRVSGKAVAVYALWGVGIGLLAGAAFIAFVAFNPPGPTHG
jgi:hypothetical protein